MFLEGGESRNAEVSVDQQTSRNWRLDGRQWRPRSKSDSDDDDDEQEGEEDGDDGDEGGGNGRGLVNVKDGREPVAAMVSSGSDGGKENNNNSNKEYGSNIYNDGRGSISGAIVQCVPEKVCEVNAEMENGGCNEYSENHLPSFGLSGGGFTKVSSVHSPSNARGSLIECRSTRLDDCTSASCEKAVVVAEPDSYYPHALQRSTSSVTKEAGGENGSGFSRRKNAFLSGEPGNSLRAILSDPITGVLMDDAIILACGHSFGAGGMQKVLKMQACYSCGQSISADSMSPNLSLRTVVQAFRREELQLSRAPKRRRERFEQEKGNFGALLSANCSRGRSIMFPFVIGDQVIIKGNKRTAERFFGREAVVTSQCLNGWYVVKTLDNAESVKLQYRSLSKVGNRVFSNGM